MKRNLKISTIALFVFLFFGSPANIQAGNKEDDNQKYATIAFFLSFPMDTPWLKQAVETDDLDVAFLMENLGIETIEEKTALNDLPKIIAEKTAEAGGERLASHRIGHPVGQSAELQSMWRLQYFEKEEGRFTLKEIDPSESSGITLKVSAVPEGQMIRVEYEIRVVAVTAREDIPGVDLEVGKPVLQTKQMQTSMTVRPGQWTLPFITTFAGESAGEERAVIMLSRTETAQK